MAKMSDKPFLTRVVAGIHDALKSDRTNTLFRVIPHPKIRASNTQGWRAELARFRDRKCYLEVWLDRFPDPGERKFYYGFYSENAGVIVRIEKRLRKILHEPIILTTRDIDLDASEFRLKRKFQEKDFGKPVLE